MIKFEKVSFEQFSKDLKKLVSENKLSLRKIRTEEDIKEIYDNIKLPERATNGAAGYDFYIPFAFDAIPLRKMLLVTGIKAQMDKNVVLNLYLRSSLGIKFDIELCNTVGVIDSDYYNNPTNEGHILVCIRNNDKMINKFDANSRIVQGVFTQYLITDDDKPKSNRSGGIGSTGE